jgi:WD40 repeat protein/transcriptional regulator with XRE-family HTH domain
MAAKSPISHDSGYTGKADTRQGFAHELTLLRERAGLTVRDVAKAAGIPDSTVGGYFGGRHLPPLKPPDQLERILRVCGVHDQVVIDDWLGTLRRIRRTPGKRPVDAPAPYRGLASFQPSDAEWFYGRQRLTDLLMEHLRARYRGGGLLFAVGPSGSGKSSLLRAGMVPSLRAGGLRVPGSADWPVALFSPGARPVHELAAQLAQLAGGDMAVLTESLLAEPDRCAEVIQQALRPESDERAGPRGDGVSRQRLVIVVDQFEEVFTLCREEGDRQAFITALSATANCPAAALVVLGLRADFYPNALRCSKLVPALQDHQVVVGPMTEAEMRSAIVEPAKKARLDIEDGLVEVLLRDISPAAAETDSDEVHGAGSLPLLSHALLATWERAHRGRMTIADYQESGGIHGAVASTAEQAFDELTSAQRDLARQIFIRLVHVANDTADTRRRTPRSELLFNDEDAQTVLDLFVDRRLVTAGTNDVEIAHEALLSAWPRLRDWIDADREGVRIQRQVTGAAEAWRDSDHDPNALYRGGRLDAARGWADSPARFAGLNLLEHDFLRASIDNEAAEGRAARRRTRAAQRLVASLAVLLLIAGFLAVYAFRQQAAATGQRDLAISRQVAIYANQLRSTDIALADQLALAAYRIAPTTESRSSLLDSYSGPFVTRIVGSPGVMQTVAFARGDSLMAAGGDQTAIRLWRLTHLARPVPVGGPFGGFGDTVFSVAFSPDGQTLASGGSDDKVQLWDMRDPARAVPWSPPLTGPGNTVYSVAFSPDGAVLAAGSADGTVRLWDVADPRHPVPLGGPLRWPGSGYVQSVAFSPYGNLLAAGGAGQEGKPGGSVRLWDVSDPGHPVPVGPVLTGPAKEVFCVAFSPDGRLLAAGSADNTVHLWDISDPRRPRPDGPPLKGPSTWVNSVAFSPDGDSLAGASSDSNVWVWDLATRRVIMKLAHPAPVTAVAYLGSASALATSDADGVARIWHLPGPDLSGEPGPFFTADFARDGVLAVDSAGNTARLWDVADPRRPVPLGPILPNAARSRLGTGAAALSSDGDTLVVGAGDGTSQVWNVRDRADPVPLGQLRGPAGVVQSIAFSPDGRLLAVGANDKAVWLWDLATPTHPVLLARLTGPTNYVYSVAFSADGRVLAAGSLDGHIYLWSLRNPRRPVPVGGHPLDARSYVDSVAFSPDSQTLAVGSSDGDVKLWNLTNPNRPSRLGPTLTGPKNYVYSVAFSADGRTLAATDGTGLIWLWNVAFPTRPSLRATLTGSSGAIFDDSFAPSGPILVTAGADNVVRLWDTSAAQVASMVCATSGDPITRSEWRSYIQGLPYNPPC